MDLSLLLGVVLMGAAVGFLSGAFGKGGSAIATPLLHAIGVPAIAAIASPLPATVPSTLLAGRRYQREGHVDRRLLVTGVVIGTPATAVGALLTRWLPAEQLVLASDMLVLILGLRIFFSAWSSDDTTSDVHPTFGRVFAVITAVGLVSGLLGNSGGFLLAPLFVSVLGLSVHRALGTSLMLSAFLAVPGTIVHAWLGHIDWSVTFAFAFGAIPLAVAGARVALRTKQRPLSLAYGAVLAVLASGLLTLAH